MRRGVGFVAVLFIIGMGLAGGLLIWPHSGLPVKTHLVPHVSESRVPRSTNWINGVDLARYSSLAKFEHTTGEKPEIVGIYVRFSDPFPSAEVRAIEATGAEPIIQVLPRASTPMSRIAAGFYDDYLRSWRIAIRSTHQPIIISFAHEMNGPWFPWGCHHTSARLYISTWKHVHEVIGTHNVTWLWNVNEGWTDAPCKMLSRWPGRAYVNLVGLDGYLRRGNQLFHPGISQSIRRLQSFTGLPVLMAEAGVAVGPHPGRRMASLYRGCIAIGCRGIVYFDSATRKGDYRPQDSPALLAAFRAALRMTPH